MPTSVHIPKALLLAVDRRARRLKISRNRLIVQALERELVHASDWSPDFFERLTTVPPGDAEAVDDLLEAVKAHRTRKGPPEL